MDFKLNSDYIELNKLLKLTGIAESGGNANAMIKNEEVFYNGKVESRKRLKVRKGDRIQVHQIEINILN